MSEAEPLPPSQRSRHAHCISQFNLPNVGKSIIIQSQKFLHLVHDMSTFIPGPNPETNISRHKISLNATGYIFKITA